ncbi:ComEC/Rec2 family competence protein [Flexithrix dorotheae]|uniref:ComEC/Rec2 family competence protein n=1 Tax=Flexithrix dorotheae TaxID=70993 RepID=UPI00036C3DEF|nr:ComEC/Rec2 family competence protein [Flexithrix dorotheae]
MFRWIPFVFIRFTFFLITGILFFIHTDVEIPRPYLIFSGFVLIYILSYFFRNKLKGKLNLLFGLNGSVILFLFGYLITLHNSPVYTPNHLANLKEKITHYQGIITSDIQEKPNSQKFALQVKAVKTANGWQEALGKVLVYVSKSDSTNLNYGEEILVSGNPQEVSPPANPNEFNYKRYLSFHHIYHQHFLKAGRFVKTGDSSPNFLLEYSYKARKACAGIFKQYIEGEKEYHIASALVLGVKDGLDNEIKNAYSSAGAMHVLAVSGLHVGIIYQVLVMFFGRLLKRKNGRWLFGILALWFLWAYAFITGLSPSVLRAVTMFSFVVLARVINRQSNIYNTLALSAFVLLCWNPYLLLEVGFQLSYLAVFGIVYLQPKLYRLFEIHHDLLDKVWGITCVSIAAQIATFPVGLLYFHQFPNYFLISNLVVIPAALIIVYGGLLLLVLSFSSFLAGLVGICLKWIIWILNEFVFYIEDLPYSLLQGIDISITETWMIYGVIVSLILLFSMRKFNYLIFAFLIFMSFSGFQVLENIAQNNQQFFTIYKVNGQSAFAFFEGEKAFLLADSSLLNDREKVRFHIDHHFWNKGVSGREEIAFQNLDESDQYFPVKKVDGNLLFVWNGFTFLNLRKKPAQPLQTEVDFLIISKQSVTDFREIQQINCRKIIIDSSNKVYKMKRLIGEMKEKKMPYFIISDNGAFTKKIP